MKVLWRGQTTQARLSKQAYLYRVLEPYWSAINLVFSRSQAGEEFYSLHNLEDGFCLSEARANLRADLVDKSCRGVFLWLHDLHQREDAQLVLEGALEQSHSAQGEAGENFNPRVKALIFSSARNLEQFKYLFGLKPPLYYLPYPASSPNFIQSLPESPLNLAFVGSALAEDQAHLLCQALQGLPQLSLQWLFTGGDLEEARELLARYGLKNSEIREASSTEDWVEILGKSQIVCHLLYTAFADPGPYLSLSLASGKPVVGNNFGELAKLPPAVIQRVQIGDKLVENLRYTLASIASSLPQSSSPSLAYAKEFLAPDLIAADLGRILQTLST